MVEMSFLKLNLKKGLIFMIPHDFDPFWMFKEGAGLPFSLSPISMQGVGQQVQEISASAASTMAAGLVVDAAFFGLLSWVTKTIDGWRVTQLLEYVQQHNKPNADMSKLISQSAFDIMLLSYVDHHHQAVLRNHGDSRINDAKALIKLWQARTLSLERFIRMQVEYAKQFDNAFISAGVNRCTLAFVTNCCKPCGWISNQEGQYLWNYYRGHSVTDFTGKMPERDHPLGAKSLGELIRQNPQKVMQYLNTRYVGRRYMMAEDNKGSFAEVVRGD